jgi:hypothetical protein
MTGLRRQRGGQTDVELDLWQLGPLELSFVCLQSVCLQSVLLVSLLFRRPLDHDRAASLANGLVYPSRHHPKPTPGGLLALPPGYGVFTQTEVQMGDEPRSFEAGFPV